MQREPSPALALPLAAAWRALLPLVVAAVLRAGHGVAADGARPRRVRRRCARKASAGRA
jgi:hypothetical protein